MGPAVCTNLSAPVSADIYKLAWQAIKYMPVTGGEMTELPLSVVFSSRTSWMAQSQMLLHALASLLLMGLTQQGRGHSSGCVGHGQLQRWQRRGRASGSLQRSTELWRNLSVRGEERCGAHHLPACNPEWKWHVRLSNNAWHLPSEATKGLWAGHSITPPISTDGKIEAQGSEIT